MKTVIFLPFFLLISLPPVVAQPKDSGLILRFSAKAPGQDLSGMNNSGEWHYVSSGPAIPGISDQSLSFDGSTSYIRIPPSASLNDCKSMTITAWFNAPALPTGITYLLLIGRRLPGKYQMMNLAVNQLGTSFCQTDGDAFPGVGFLDYVKKDTWYHTAGVFDFEKHELRIYLNGVLREILQSNIVPIISKETPLYIGVDKALVTLFFKVNIEDLRIYNRALNDREIKALTKEFVFPEPEDPFKKIEKLDAGRYIFGRLDSSGHQKGPNEIVEIITEEPLWKKGWFISGCLAGTFLLTFLIAFLYNRYQQQEQAFEFEKRQILERERFRIARDMHDDIGSGLSAINLLTEIALNKSKDPQLAGEIQRIASAAREVNTRIQDIIWAISAQNDTVASLLQHLQRFAADLLAPTGIILQFKAPLNLPVSLIPGDHRRAVFLAFKEALHNIVKHAHATQVDIDVSASGKQLIIRVRDNGRGFDPMSANDSGNGLLNMRRRLEELGGQFCIASGGHGTTVALQLLL